MKCPSCGSTAHTRFRSPTEKQEIVLRRHRCLECGEIFISAQTVVTPDLASVLLPLIDRHR